MRGAPVSNNFRLPSDIFDEHGWMDGTRDEECWLIEDNCYLYGEEWKNVIKRSFRLNGKMELI